MVLRAGAPRRAVGSTARTRRGLLALGGGLTAAGFLRRAVAVPGAVLPGRAAGRSAESKRSDASDARVALVIGVGGYRSGRLANPVNDARLMGQTLREIGFDVSQYEDISQDAMLDAMREWLVESRHARIRLFYFAGHGLQSGGRNFLLPVDARLDAGAAVFDQSVNLSSFVGRLSQIRRGVNIVILDACRNLPPALYAQGPRTRSGMAAPDPGFDGQPAPRGTLVAFATAPGATAADGVGARHSAYTRHLARLLKVRGLPLEQVFKRVRLHVMEETRDAQTPWESSSLVGDVCLQPLESGACANKD
ncbi:MAG: caspase family protein [Burkholderiaceae bacterium]